MNEIELTEENKITIKKYIKLDVFLIIIFFSALIFIVGIIPVALLIFKKPTERFLNRSLLIMSLLFIPFIGVIWKVIKTYIDIRSGKKLRFEIANFEIKKEKKSTVLIDNKTQNKFKIDEYLIPYIKTENPIKIEITKLSKELLFISNETENYITKAEKEEKQNGN